MSKFNLAISGTRYFNSYNEICNYLWHLYHVTPEGLSAKDITFLFGDARGVDKLARMWCEANNLKYIVFNADWKAYGKLAGPLRNKRMIDIADALIAIPAASFHSKGTWNAIGLARDKGIPVKIFPVDVEKPKES